MRIYQIIRLQGAMNASHENALIDTGASISIIPVWLARVIGAWHTNQTVNIMGVHGQSRTLPLGAAHLYFSSLNDIGRLFVFAVSDIEREPIIGMDILTPLGIIIDTKTGQLSVKNEVWEAFKTLSEVVGVGALIFVGIKALDSVFE